MIVLFGHNLMEWVVAIGYVGVLAVIFIETALFVGFFLPGDSLLFVVGFLCAQKIFNIWFFIPALITAAILGYLIAYWFGAKLGSWLLGRDDSFWFKKRYLFQARDFYAKHGGKALILGRLIPVLRTFVPIVAGIADMHYGYYVWVTIVGAFVWAGGVTLLGYFLGNIIPNAEHYILPIVLAIIVLSISPALFKFLQEYFRKRRLR